MRAVGYRRFGAARDVLETVDLPVPDPGPGEVLVSLHYSGVNPSDVKARGGTRPGVTEPAFPFIVPHSDGSGVIEAVGDGVPQTRIGERVWIWNGQWQRAFGTAAEFIALPAEQAVTLPEDVTLHAGATLGIPGLTAAHTVFGGCDIAGQTLLISGGAGSVGHNAVQLAKWGGARVISTCSPANADRVREAGADEVLDYRDPDLAKKVMDLTGGTGIDRAVEVEFGVNAALLGEVMKPNGTIAVYGSALDMAPELPFGAYLFKALTIDIALIYILERDKRDAAITRLHAALGADALTPEFTEDFTLSDCAVAHEAVEQGNRRGAVLLNLAE